jgi:hypothetical protein
MDEVTFLTNVLRGKMTKPTGDSSPAGPQQTQFLKKIIAEIYTNTIGWTVVPVTSVAPQSRVSF